MPKVSVDIPDKAIDEVTAKKIKELERKLLNAENREKRLKAELADNKKERETVVRCADKLSSLILDIKEEDIFRDLFYPDDW